MAGARVNFGWSLIYGELCSRSVLAATFVSSARCKAHWLRAWVRALAWWDVPDFSVVRRGPETLARFVGTLAAGRTYSRSIADLFRAE
jgi:hypothetical protein